MDENESDSSQLRTKRTQVYRRPERACYNRAVIYEILDQALYCHVGFIIENQPYVIPTIHTRVDDVLYLHGSAANRMLGVAAQGNRICVSVTLLDGLVLARSAFHHSMNYRSAVILSTAAEVTDQGEKRSALKALVEHIVTGRWTHIRHPSDQELAATKLLRIGIDEASVKIRTGPPVDDPADYALPYWAGEIPMEVVAGGPVPDPKLVSNGTVPEHVRLASRGKRHHIQD